MDENIVKLNEKMKELLALAKKKQNVLLLNKELLNLKRY